MARFALLVMLSSLVSACALNDDGDEPWTDEDNVVSDDDQASDQALDDVLRDSKADGALSYRAVAQLAKDAGISCSGDRIAVATAVAKAESSFRPTISNTVGNAHGIDRGLWQINSYWHPEVSVACALSASCNARAAARISSRGTKWSQWWTFKNGKHLPFMSQARAARAVVCP